MREPAFICPSCGPDLDGQDVHVLVHHSHPPRTRAQALRELRRAGMLQQPRPAAVVLQFTRLRRGGRA